MRIAVSGSHRTGKTTLISEIAAICPVFHTFEEPYYQLSEEGHTFAEMPCLEDFEAQLDRSVSTLEEGEGHCLFDRCPLDILAYLIAHQDSSAFDLHAWLSKVRQALQRLNFIAFVPIEVPDRVPPEDPEGERLRRRVHDELVALVLQDDLGFHVPVIEVTGEPAERARQVLDRAVMKRCSG